MDYLRKLLNEVRRCGSVFTQTEPEVDELVEWSQAGWARRRDWLENSQDDAIVGLDTKDSSSIHLHRVQDGEIWGSTIPPDELMHLLDGRVLYP